MEAINHPQTYKDGTRVLFLKGRNKDGRHDQRVVMRVSHSAPEFDQWLHDLHGIANTGERIYASAGARDLARAIRIFKERQLAADYDEDTEAFYRKLNARWCSCLMSPMAQAEKLWLFDCDTEADVALVRSELAAHYSRPRAPYWYRSKSGWHAIVAPFDRSALSDPAKALIHDNALMLWAY